MEQSAYYHSHDDGLCIVVSPSQRGYGGSKLYRVGRRLGSRLTTDSASSLSIGTGLAGTTTLPLFTLPRFWSCYSSLGCFHLKVRPFALKGTCFQPFPAMQEFDSPLDGALHGCVLPLRANARVLERP